ncbi:MAG: amino acid carrier protein [Flavobacteriales bacterium]|jgi:alanine or glycine:cation symporter, AGCS family|nr:amino acid carrier protein [Flavobacteriales bacterium]
MKKKLLLFTLTFSFIMSSVAQLSIIHEISNKSEDINDGKISVTITGGQEPYSYFWSDKNSPRHESFSDSLTEGVEHTLTITDVNGLELKKSFTIETESVQEKINNAFIPIVSFLDVVIFWDPFYTLGIYDNVLRMDDGTALTNANGTNKTTKIPIVVVWLVLGAIFFTVRMKFINIRGFKHAISLVKGDYDDPNDKGEVSHFQALTTALSATVGLGNIAGVAIAIAVGGPGATFWMIVAGLLGMSSKFVECTLGVKYRKVDDNGEVSGGPMYYLRDGLAKYKAAGLGKVLAVIFAVLCIGGSFGGGNMFQANQAYEILGNQFPMLADNGPAFGFILAILVGTVIIGGIKSIANVTDKIVPFMALLYVGAAFVVIFANFGQIGSVFGLIFDGAFNSDAALGGVIGVLIQGFRRAAFSNEAGVGSASIAHSAAKTNEPISEGIVSLLEPLIDTVVICTMTALVIIITGHHDISSSFDGGASLTSSAFGSVISWFPYLLVIAIFLFAFSTMISWSYYGLKSWEYLFGKSKFSEYSYKLIFLIFIIIGSSVSLGAVLDFSDMMILAMAFPNIIGLLFLSKEVRTDLDSYFSRLKSGEIKKFK